MKIQISEVYPKYVFSTIGTGKIVDCIDFKKKQYIVLADQTVAKVQAYIDRRESDDGIKFFQIDYVEEE